MSSKEHISHPGIIDHVTDESIFVKIMSMSACSSCNARGMCNASEMEEKVVEVKKDPSRDLKTGEEVKVTMWKSQGGKAVFLGYIMPFLVMIGMLLMVLSLSGNEGLAGLLAILVLIPYYWLLYIYRDKLKSTFSFRIE